MDYYKDDHLDPIPRRSSRYSREHERDYYDERHYDYDRELDYRSSFPPPVDDPLYRSMMTRPLLPRPRESSRDMIPSKEALSEGVVSLGSIVLIPTSPFDPKPKRRERPPSCRTIFVGSLPDNCGDNNLYDLFSKCGSIVEVRVSKGRNFGHVQFNVESSVERAMELSGCIIRIENSTLSKDTSKIHVDYAQDKADIDLKRRIQDDEMLSFTPGNVVNISTDLHRDDAFGYAVRNVMHWLEKGSCDNESANTFFGLINSISSQGRKVAKNIQAKEEEDLEYRVKKMKLFQTMAESCDVMLKVYETAGVFKTWNNFTKAQRKSITQWKEQAMDLKDTLAMKLEDKGNDAEEDREATEPPRKMAKMDRGKFVEADLSRALREIEQLKTDREVAVEKKDKQILQLKTLMAKFKKSCPEEWEKALGVKADKSSNSDKSLRGDEEKGNGDDEGNDIVDGVSLDDLNALIDKDAGDSSLASAAAAYAQMREQVGSSSEHTGLGLSEAEVAIVSVLAVFLTVHPLGATIEAITTYFQNFNPAYNSYYLESLLRRLTKVFQLSGEGNGKWWFLGFQTCYATPSNTKVKIEPSS